MKEIIYNLLIFLEYYNGFMKMYVNTFCMVIYMFNNKNSIHNLT